MGILYIISLIVFIIYLSASALVFGITKSISETYYKWKEVDEDYSILFTSFIWGVTFPLMIVWIEILPNDLNFVPFIAAASLMFVGTATSFKESLTDKIHYISALIASIVSFTWSFAYGSVLLASLFIIVGIILVLCSKNKDIKTLYWLEIIAFVNMYTQLALLL